LIHDLRPFRIWPRIRRDKSTNIRISVGALTPRKSVFKKTLPLSVSTAGQTCNDLRNGYSS
jgi:hypothetical protein